MSVEGMQKFYADLGVSLENAESLIACHILDFESFAAITLNDYNQAMERYNATTVRELSRAVWSHITSYRHISMAKDFMDGAFQRGKEETTANVLKAETGIDIIECFFEYNRELKSNKVAKILVQYLKESVEKGERKVFRKDEWSMLVEFVNTHQDGL